jgi:hypothetical protein
MLSLPREVNEDREVHRSRTADAGLESGHGAWPTKGLILSMIALLIGGEMPKIRPGGPFISVTHEVLPLILSLWVIYDCLSRLRLRVFGPRLAALVVSLLATLAIAKVLITIIAFWMHPYARGDLIGF